MDVSVEDGGPVLGWRITLDERLLWDASARPLSRRDAEMIAEFLEKYLEGAAQILLDVDALCEDAEATGYEMGEHAGSIAGYDEGYSEGRADTLRDLEKIKRDSYLYGYGMGLLSGRREGTAS